MKKYKYRTVVIIVVILVLMTASGVLIFNSRGYGKVDYIYPKFNLSDKLYVIKGSNMNDGERVMIETLQGIVAQNKSAIYIDYGGAYEKWLADLKDTYKIEYEYVESPWDLVRMFKNEINENGYILYKTKTPSINAACTISGVLKYLAVSSDLSKKAEENGLVMKIDVSDKDEYWAYSNYKDRLNNSFIIQQNYENLSLRDYGTAIKGLYGYDIGSTKRLKDIFSWLKPNAIVLGWHKDEVSGVSFSSKLGKVTVASDHANNLTVFSALPRENFKQKPTEKNIVEDTDVHYVTFIMSDGDNVQWYCNGYPFDTERLGHSKDDTIPFGWSISPGLVDLAPNIMKYCYRNATKDDYFVASVSGFGYIYPSMYPKDALSQFADSTNKYMKRAGLKYISILDEKSSQDVVDTFAKEDQIQGGFYFYGDRYAGGKGAIFWSGNKPFVSVRETLWETNPQRMAVRINSYKRNPKVIEGYTLVNVHPWSHNYLDAKMVVENLDPHVKVVTPDEFIELIKKNVEHKNVKALNDVTKFDYTKMNQKK